MRIRTFLCTVAHLKPQQIVARLRFRLRRVRVGHVENPQLAGQQAEWRQSIPKRAAFQPPATCEFLNSTVTVDEPRSWNNDGIDKLLLYHLHYLDVLHGSGGRPAKKDGDALIRRWIDENPPPHGNGWEPYPLSLRIVNLIKWHLEVTPLSANVLESLFLQARALSQQIEYHLSANHLFANAKALYLAGLFFTGDEAQGWRHTGAGILTRELPEQVLDDGGHFELSTMYHANMTEDVLDLINAQRAFGSRSLTGLTSVAKSMLSWLRPMTHPDRCVARFNDSVDGVAPSLDELQAYSRRLGIDEEPRVAAAATALSASGYFCFARGAGTVIVDAGHIGPRYQPGHGHCDCLSFELSIDDRRFLVNTGISTYATGERRLLERRTAAHNTVSIVGHEQSDVWSSFRVGQRARPVEIKFDDKSVSAAHDGFRRLGVIHKRSLELTDIGLTVTDELLGKDEQVGIAHFHFAPGVEPRIEGNSVVTPAARLSFDTALEIQLADYEYAAGFYALVPSRKVSVSFSRQLVTSIEYADTVRQR